MTSFKMLLLFFMHLIKYPQRNVNIALTMIIYFFLFPYISSDFCFIYLCFFVVRCLMVYDVYLICELYLVIKNIHLCFI